MCANRRSTSRGQRLPRCGVGSLESVTRVRFGTPRRQLGPYRARLSRFCHARASEVSVSPPRLVGGAGIVVVSIHENTQAFTRPSTAGVWVLLS